MGTSRQFATRLGELMEKNGLTNTQLAAIVGVTPSAVSQWMATENATLPTTQKLWRLESLFRMEHGSLWELAKHDRMARRDKDTDKPSANPNTPRLVTATGTGSAHSSERAVASVTPKKINQPLTQLAQQMGSAWSGRDSFDPDDIVFQSSAEMTRVLAEMKSKLDRAEILRTEARDLFEQANDLGQLAPGREAEIRDLSRRAGQRLAQMDNLLAEVADLRNRVDSRRQLMQYVVATTRHVIGEDDKDPEKVQEIKAKDVARRGRDNQYERRRALLNREYDRVEDSLQQWFQANSQPDVTPLLSLLLSLVNQVNSLHKENAEQKAELADLRALTIALS